MSSKTVYPTRRIWGAVTLPGDKSISHRAAMIAAISHGTSKLVNYAPSQDCQSTLGCLRALGVSIEPSGNAIQIHGRGLKGLQPPKEILDAGNSGTTIRLLSGILAGQPFESVLTGDESLRRRPMRRIIEPLTRMGAQITALEGGVAPLRIRGGALQPITYSLPVASAQVKSCLLLAGLFADGVTTVGEPAPTRNHTEIMLDHFGARVEVTDRTAAVTGPANLKGREYHIPGDISSAAFLIAAALALPDSTLRLKDIGVNATRSGFIDLLRRFGAAIELENRRAWQGEPVADLVVRSSRLRNPTQLTVGGDVIPTIIDEIPILAVLATQIDGGLSIRDAGELRVKESDRLRALADNLRQMGADVEEFEDGLSIPGPQPLRGAQIDSDGDHRIVMAFAIAGLLAAESTEIQSSEAVDISFPSFFELLEQVIGQ
ncbi:MAG: 3-phosphoshikimate 1-carboxyvinyltransferase [Acidobacteria bacterium]|nr:3-phosphoshikimate 1-carboxyvinyltransferase [Acidobacteriota bacterium]